MAKTAKKKENSEEQLRLLEAVLFAATEPLDNETLVEYLGTDSDVESLLSELKSNYDERGVHLMKRGNRWQFTTASDLAPKLQIEREKPRRLSRASLETLAIVAYHQPVTRGEIENIRGVQISKGSLEQLVDAGWVKPGKRREVPGRPLTWLTTQEFMEQFGLESLNDLPGVEDLRTAGLLDARPAIATIAPANDEIATEEPEEEAESEFDFNDEE